MEIELKAELEIYEENLAFLAEHKVPFAVTNAGPQHAWRLISKIVSSAQKSIKVYAHCMNGDLSESHGSTLVSDYCKAAENGRSIEILLERVPATQSTLLNSLKGLAEKGKNIKIRIATEEFRNDLKKEFRAVNYFTLGDDCMYRREYDALNHIAIGNFNDEKSVSRLSSIFDCHFNTSPEATIAA